MKAFTIYILPFIILMVAELLYFKLADHLNIIDKPNQRSSHMVPTTRGGGIVFLLAVILFFCFNDGLYPYLLAAMLLSGITSFIDDIRPLPNYIKFSAHIGSVVLVFRESGLLMSLSPVYLVAIGVVMIGVINAYNFMDGINGITGLYSLAVIVPLLITETNEQLKLLELFSLAGLLVFNFFNTRKNARCFAGDVGSISLAVLIIFLIIMRIQLTYNFSYIALLLVYGIDSVYTIAQRLYQRENIFKPHRKHLYQYLSNEGKIPHVWVSIFYAVLQFCISLSIVYADVNYMAITFALISLSVLYWILKAPFLKASSR